MNYLEMLREGTSNPMVARNWHLQGVVKKAESQVVELATLCALVRNDKSLYQSFMRELKEAKSIIAIFLEAWPKPTTSYIKDALGYIAPSDLNRAVFAQSRPLKSLVHNSSDRFSSRIVYLDSDNGGVYSVPNIHYNQPNKAVLTTFDY